MLDELLPVVGLQHSETLLSQTLLIVLLHLLADSIDWFLVVGDYVDQLAEHSLLETPVVMLHGQVRALLLIPPWFIEQVYLLECTEHPDLYTLPME